MLISSAVLKRKLQNQGGYYRWQCPSGVGSFGRDYISIGSYCYPCGQHPLPYPIARWERYRQGNICPSHPQQEYPACRTVCRCELWGHSPWASTEVNWQHLETAEYVRTHGQPRFKRNNYY